MGYNYHITEQDFFIEASNRKLARKAIIEKVFRYLGFTEFHISEATSFRKAMAICNFDIKLDAEKNVVKISLAGDNKLWMESEVFRAIAPYVKTGSYIQGAGDDGEIWRWVFDGISVKHVDAKITWE
jgi:hypothetical protein